MKDIKNAIQWITDLEKAIDHFCDDFKDGCTEDCPFFCDGDCSLYMLETQAVRRALRHKQTADLEERRNVAALPPASFAVENIKILEGKK